MADLCSSAAKVPSGGGTWGDMRAGIEQTFSVRSPEQVNKWSGHARTHPTPMMPHSHCTQGARARTASHTPLTTHTSRLLQRLSCAFFNQEGLMGPSPYAQPPSLGVCSKRTLRHPTSSPLAVTRVSTRHTAGTTHSSPGSAMRAVLLLLSVSVLGGTQGTCTAQQPHRQPQRRQAERANGPQAGCGPPYRPLAHGPCWLPNSQHRHLLYASQALGGAP